MPEQVNSFVAGYIFNFPGGPRFVPITEGGFCDMVRIKEKCKNTDLHGNRIITGCPWEVRRASEVF